MGREKGAGTHKWGGGAMEKGGERIETQTQRRQEGQ